MEEGKAPKKADLGDDSDSCGEDDFVNNAMGRFVAKRAEWAHIGSHLGDYFQLFVGGGRWLDRRGLDFEGVRVHAKSPEAKYWCRRYGRPLIVDFIFSKYSEEVAAVLVLEWCRRQQAFYNIYVAVQDFHFKFIDAHDLGPHDASYQLVLDSNPFGNAARARAEVVFAVRPRNL